MLINAHLISYALTIAEEIQDLEPRILAEGG